MPASKSNKTINDSDVKPRKRKESSHRTFRLSSRKFIKRKVSLVSSWKFLKETFKFLANNKKLFLSMIAIYVLAQFILVYIFGGGLDYSQAKQEIRELIGSNAPSYSVAYGLANYLFVSVGQRNNEILGTYQNFVSIIFILATIWVVRQKTAKEKFSASDVFYKSQYPIIQFLAVIFIIGFSFVPAMIGGFMYSVAITQGIAVLVIEKVIWIAISALLLLLTLYLLLPGILAIYIVTLPEVSPRTAYTSAWKLLDGRRWSVGIRLIAGYIFISIFGLLLMMVLSYFLTPISEIIFYFVTAISMLVVNIYTYKIYRAML